MRQVERISIGLPEEVADALREVVASGASASFEEATRDALEEWRLERAVALGITDDEIRELLADVPQDDAGRPAEEFFEELRDMLDREFTIEAKASSARQPRRA